MVLSVSSQIGRVFKMNRAKRRAPADVKAGGLSIDMCFLCTFPPSVLIVLIIPGSPSVHHTAFQNRKMTSNVLKADFSLPFFSVLFQSCICSQCLFELPQLKLPEKYFSNAPERQHFTTLKPLQTFHAQIYYVSILKRQVKGRKCRGRRDFIQTLKLRQSIILHQQWIARLCAM